MLENIYIIRNHSQVKQLSNKLKYQILNELINNAATCQQLADIFAVSKQKIHYLLKELVKEELISVDDNVAPDNNKEKYFRARAKNYILDFSLGTTKAASLNHRELVHNILDMEHKVSLGEIAANILDNSLRMKPKQSLFINTGEYNMPLVRRIVTEAAKRQISVTLKYQDRAMVQDKYDQLSYSALTRDFENFNKLLRQHDIYLNLNGEARFVQPPDKYKLEIQQRSLQKSLEIIKKNNIKVAMMPGLNNETLSENAILTELNFWKAINVDYRRLYEETEALREELSRHKWIEIESGQHKLKFEIESIFCEYGSFTDNPSQIPVINLPGGEILIMPKPGSLNGTVQGDMGYTFGEKVSQPFLQINDNAIATYSAAHNGQLIRQSIDDGGKDGGRIAFICLGTNYNMGLEHIDLSYKSKTKGFLSLYWGENVSMGGTVAGKCEWMVLLDDFKLNLT